MRTSVLAALIVIVAPATAADWPCWRGPDHNGNSRESNWKDTWPAGGPPVLWKANVGVGFSSMAVAGGRVYTLGNDEDRDTIVCLDARTGKPIWKHSYESPRDPKNFEGGPTATPCVDGRFVYSLGRRGDLVCLDAAGGKVIWSKNVATDLDQRVPSWGLAGSPIVHDDLLLLNVGDAGLALDKLSGKVVWQSERRDAGYSSPVPFRRGGDWFAVFSNDEEYVAANLRTGKELWRINWPTRNGVNAADPIVADGQVLVSSGYGKGAGLFSLSGGKPAEVWKNKSLRTQINSAVLLDGFVYGIDGDAGNRAKLTCLDWKTGAVRWSEPAVGCGSVMAADGKLIVLSEVGELIIAPASPEKFAPSAKAKVLDGKCWTVPVLCDGRAYCRDAAGDVVCIDLNR